MSTDERRFYRVPEVAIMLGVSRARVYELVANGAIPSVRLGVKRIMVPAAAIEAMERDAAARALAVQDHLAKQGDVER